MPLAPLRVASAFVKEPFRACARTRFARSLWIAAVVFSLVSASVAAAENRVHGALSVEGGGKPITDKQFRKALDTAIPHDRVRNTVIILTQCFGGDMVDDLESRPGTTILSATSSGEDSYGWWYDLGAAKGLEPAPGWSTTDLAELARIANTLGGVERSTSQLVGPEVSLENTDPNGPAGSIRSRHILFYAGIPSRNDHDLLERITREFSQEKATTIHPIMGGTYLKLTSMLAVIRAAIEASGYPQDEQLIVYVSDHGVQVIDNPNVAVPGSGAKSQVNTIPGSSVAKMRREVVNDLGTGIDLFLPGNQTYVPESFSLTVNSLLLTDSTFEIRDADLDGDLLDDGDGTYVSFNAPENVLLGSSTGDAEVAIDLTNHLASPLFFDSVGVDVGPIDKVFDPETPETPTLSEVALSLLGAALLAIGLMTGRRRSK